MKLNKTKTVKEVINSIESKTENKAGGVAFELTPKERLVQRVLTTLFGEKKYYGNQDKEIVEDIKLVAKTDPEFILKLAAYARKEMYLRTIPQVLAVESANLEEFKGKGLINKYTKHIVQRADEITEMLAYQLQVYGKPVPNALIRGLKPAFEKFDEYQFAKYNRKGNVSLKDAMRIVHPKPKGDERAKLYNSIIKDTLKTPETWEVVISTKGSTKEAWESVIPKMGYMALLRNLRNFLKVDVDIKPVIARLTNKEQIERSKQFPFRFLSAYREIQNGETYKNTGVVLNAIHDAMEISVCNLPTLKGTTFMSSDNSGSMDSKLSERGSVSYKDIANLLQAVSTNLCETAMTSVFADQFKLVNISSRSSILDNIKTLENQNIGWCTNGWKVINHLHGNKIKVDRIVIFTDEQMYDSRSSWMSDDNGSFIEEFLKYKRFNPNVYLYIMDLSGNGTCVVPTDQPRVALINGWSEKVLNFIDLFEKGKDTMISTIEAYKP